MELAKNGCAQLLLLAKTVLKEAYIVQSLFSRVPWMEDCAHANKENMYLTLKG